MCVWGGGTRVSQEKMRKSKKHPFTMSTMGSVWLQQHENRRAEWDDADLKLEFRRALVWNSERLVVMP